MSAAEFRFFEMLKARIGGEAAEAFAEILDRRVANKFEEKKDVLATKADLHTVVQSIADLRVEMSKLVSALETRMEVGFKDQLKWMIVTIFGFSTLIVTVIKLL